MDTYFLYFYESSENFFNLLIIILIRCAPFKADFIDGSNNWIKEFTHQRRKKYEKKFAFSEPG
jgi:hypothetical protein